MLSILKRLSLEYKWYILGAVVIVTMLAGLLFRRSSKVDDVIDWASERRLEILQERLDDKRRSSKVDKENLEDIDNKIDQVKKKREAGVDKRESLKDMSEVWSDLGY